MTPYQEAMERQVAKEGHFDVVSFRDGWNAGVAASSKAADLAFAHDSNHFPLVIEYIESLATPGSHARSRVDGEVCGAD